MLNKINDQYLMNENIDKRRVEQWLDNKIRVNEGTSDNLRPSTRPTNNSSQNSFMSGKSAPPQRHNASVLMQAANDATGGALSRNDKKDKGNKNDKYLQSTHSSYDLEDAGDSQDKYEVYVRLYTEKLWRALNKYIIA